MTITAIILCGGKGSRMGHKNKGLLELGGKPLIQRTIERLPETVTEILVSANADVDSYRSLGHTVIVDELSDCGPLAGILACSKKAKWETLYITACDTPFVTASTVSKLCQTIESDTSNLAIASDGSGIHHLCFASNKKILPSIKNYLKKGNRSVKDWQALHQPAILRITDEKSREFLNINSEHEWHSALNML